MKKMTGSILLASVLTLGAIAAPSILAATTAKSTTAEISTDTKAALDEIRTQVKAGDITHEEAHAKMEELGLDPGFGKAGHRGHHGKGPFGNIDEETRTAIKDIRDQYKAGDLTEAQAQEKIEALGLDFSSKFLTRGPSHEKLTDEQKAQLDKMREQVEAGTLTEAEAQIQMEELGFNPRGGHGEHKHVGPHMKFQQKEAPVSDESQAKSTSSEA
ncbi:hypothetical protein [Paenisporosarcina sp. TG-14]|uniref:hypothetical protein n=1 Tax=Paenisporosarcina sp. TG-14 TaxID=1231057 RepID=UPI0002D75D50|nr:hypothetical protein [Paenisporosarcina sp. TG-14]